MAESRGGLPYFTLTSAESRSTTLGDEYIRTRRQADISSTQSISSSGSKRRRDVEDVGHRLDGDMDHTELTFGTAKTALTPRTRRYKKRVSGGDTPSVLYKSAKPEDDDGELSDGSTKGHSEFHDRVDEFPDEQAPDSNIEGEDGNLVGDTGVADTDPFRGLGVWRGDGQVATLGLEAMELEDDLLSDVHRISNSRDINEFWEHHQRNQHPASDPWSLHQQPDSALDGDVDMGGM